MGDTAVTPVRTDFGGTRHRTLEQRSPVSEVIIRNARIVPLERDAAGAGDPVDLLIRDDRVAEIAPVGALAAETPGTQTIAADGRFIIPGLWDHHVHATQWARTAGQLDTSGTDSAAELAARVGEYIAAREPGDTSTVFGWGHRSAPWTEAPSVAQLDAVTGDIPTVLVSGDGHHGWVNSAALARFDLPQRDTVLAEADWFPVFGRLDELRGDGGIGSTDPDGMRAAVAKANALGIVGITDMEFGPGWVRWADRYAAGITSLRVRTATYSDTLEDVIAAGMRTGDAIAGTDGIIQMGPLKIISDGSLNTRTAWCREPYTDADSLQHPAGAPNLPLADLRGLFARGAEAGLEIACHAIGDAAIGTALDAFAESGARGGIEHAQLTTVNDIRRMAEFGVHASVQPAHLLDDRDVTHQCWADRTDFSFMLRTMLDLGVTLTMGSDAPVSPLDPWLAIASAVHRTGDDREPWNPAESLTAREALAASTNGAGTVGVGSLADLILLDRNPLDPEIVAQGSAAVAAHVLDPGVAVTMLGGRIVHDAR